MLRRGIDIRYVVASLRGGDAEPAYETIYCARGQAENLIKQHKAQLASDRTSRRSPLANQMRLILHTGAYWLLLDLRAAIPSWKSAAAHRVRYHPSASAEDRWSHDRDRKPRSHRARLMLPGGRDVQSRRAQAATVWTMSQRGGDAPRAPIHSPPTRRQRPRSNPSADPTRAEQTNSSRPKRPSDKALACIRWASRFPADPASQRFRHPPPLRE